MKIIFIDFELLYNKDLTCVHSLVNIILRNWYLKFISFTTRHNTLIHLTTILWYYQNIRYQFAIYGFIIINASFSKLLDFEIRTILLLRGCLFTLKTYKHYDENNFHRFWTAEYQSFKYVYSLVYMNYGGWFLKNSILKIGT
jgi:hypothetical protein